MRVAWPPVVAQFSVKYDGPVISDQYAIDASVLGSSLMALADLIDESQGILASDKPRYRVVVRATGGGSFEVFMELAEFWDAVVRLFSTRDAQATGLLVTIFGGGGLIGLVRWLRGRKPDDIIEMAEGTLFRVEEEERMVQRGVGSLYKSRRVRRSLQTFVRPVRRDSVDELTVQLPEDGEVVVITPDDRPSFDTPIEDEVVNDQVVTMVLRIEAIRWRSPRWEFREPTIGLLWATIEDQEFLDRLDRGEPFEKGDTLECSVRVRQWDDGEGSFRSDYTIQSVLGHHPRDSGDQLSMS